MDKDTLIEVERDKKLYMEFLAGDNSALNDLIERYRTELIYFIYTYVKDYHAAEDLSHEAFVYLLKHREIYDFKYTFRTYLYMIAKYRAFNYMDSRKNVVFLNDEDEVMNEEIANVEEEVFKNYENTRMKDIIKKLKKEYQMVIYLIEIKGLSYKETGLIMNKSLPQVKQLILHARRRLKVFIEEGQLQEKY